MNVRLKFAIFQSGKTQVEIAREAKVSESRLSRIIHHYEPTDEEKKRIAVALRIKVSDIFHDVNGKSPSTT